MGHFEKSEKKRKKNNQFEKYPYLCCVDCDEKNAEKKRKHLTFSKILLNN